MLVSCLVALCCWLFFFFFFFSNRKRQTMLFRVTGVQTCALPIPPPPPASVERFVPADIMTPTAATSSFKSSGCHFSPCDRLQQTKNFGSAPTSALEQRDQPCRLEARLCAMVPGPIATARHCDRCIHLGLQVHCHASRRTLADALNPKLLPRCKRHRRMIKRC